PLGPVAADPGPHVERTGVPVRPARRAARPAGPPKTCARMVGLSGCRSKLWIRLERLHRFHVAAFVSTDTLTVRLWLPALSDRQRPPPGRPGDRLPLGALNRATDGRGS